MGAIYTSGDASLTEQVADWRSREPKPTIGLAVGCFDLLHASHIDYLRKAKEACGPNGKLIVAMTGDAPIAKYKGPIWTGRVEGTGERIERPIQGEDVRAAKLAALPMVDAVVVYDTKMPEAIITTLQPDLVIKGSDYRTKAPDPDEVALVHAYGGQYVTTDPFKGMMQPTTTVLAQLKAGMDAARKRVYGDEGPQRG